MIIPLILALAFGHAFACIEIDTDTGPVCMCDENDCDTIPGLDDLTDQNVKVYSTAKELPGFTVKTVGFSDGESSWGTKIRIGTEKFQKIIGFGGALTDSSCQQILRLPEAAQNNLLESYFGDDGIGYNLMRVPLGGCDFSPRPYTLDDTDGDVGLDHFALQPEDLNYKIPVIKKALALRSGKPFNLFASYWTAPVWMKTNKIFNRGYSMLKRENYQLFADYIRKFLDAYAKQGIDFWGLTTGNEPANGFSNTNSVPSMAWLPTDQGDWISRNLGPTLRNSGYENVKIIIHDENLPNVPFSVTPLLENETTLNYIDGVATHWYSDGNFPPELKLLTKVDKKDTFTISSEASHFMTQPLIGDWQRAIDYINNIFEDLEYGYNGWVDWNTVLDATGGFTWIGLTADAAVVLSEDGSRFYKQPMFYALGHFAKFVIPNSVRLDRTSENDYNVISSLAFYRPDNVTVVTILNNWNTTGWAQIIDGNKYSEMIELPPDSLSTVLYRN